MFRLVKFAFKAIALLKLLSLAFAAGMGSAFLIQLRQQQRTWGVRQDDVARELAGDDLIPVADIEETRSLAIAAPPAAVWPWLAQMGYGRGGWYSYDQMDMDQPSAQTILPQFQDLAEGDLVATHPGGGFEARVVQPDEALVLYLDSELVERRTEASPEADAGASAEPIGLQATGFLGEMSMPEFRGTWAFVLVPQADGSTRLVERLRLWSGGDGLLGQASLPFMGLGVFVMTRKHMLGVKERAERQAEQSGEPSAAADAT